MESVTTIGTQPKAETLAIVLERQRHCAEQFLAVQRSRLEKAETDLIRQVQRIRRKLASSRRRSARDRTRLERRSEEVAQQTEHLRRLRHELTAQQADWEQAQQRAAEYFHQLAVEVARQPDSGAQERCQELRQQCDALAEKLVESDREAASLRTRNQELERQLAAARQEPPAAAVLDWESEKRRVLAALEADTAPGDSSAEIERLRMKDVVERTDRAMAEQRKEIADLKRLLDQRTRAPASATDHEELLDKDEIVRQERENLRRAQQQCEEKLRQAEIEISVERARLARQRCELDEKRRALSGPADPARPAASDKPPRGRWLARLGLNEPDVK
jgi:chromosome segregation ATPase